MYCILMNGNLFVSNFSIEKMPSNTLSTKSCVLEAFKEYATELDAKHDRHERLVKISRDITIESKRIIFYLHSLINSKNFEGDLNVAENRINALINGPLKKASKEAPLGPHINWIISPGLQELTEAACFLHYLRHPSEKTLPPLNFLQAVSEKESGFKNIEISPMDFILGIADYTGELMRFCINSSTNENVDACYEIKILLQHLYRNFLRFNLWNHRELYSKICVLRQSLIKVETACYELKLRNRISTHEDFNEFV